MNLHKHIIEKKVDATLLKKITKFINPSDKTTKKKQILTLPYLPECVDYSCCCQALTLNRNLFTPCLNKPAKGKEFCKKCIRTKFKYGLLKDRQNIR